MTSIAFGTIVAKNYISFARVLHRSLVRHHPEIKFFVVVTDGPDGLFDSAAEPFEIVPLAALGLPGLRGLCFGYTRFQLAIVAKPYLLRYLFQRGFEAAVFLDADILVLDRLDPLVDVTVRHPIALTPHLLDPLEGMRSAARELNVLQSGVFNAGFVGVSKSPTARDFLAWWADRMHTHCRHAVGDGMHYDQRWLDLVRGFFDDVFVVRDPGCNVAYWNLTERRLAVSQSGVVVDGGPCRFFHFSGFEPERPQRVTRYWPDLAMDHIGAAAALFERYASLLEEEGHVTTRSWPYSFARFDNGVAIPDLARRLYLDLDRPEAFGDPFCTHRRDSFFAWLREPVASHSAGLPRIWHALHRDRPDLQLAFPDIANGDGSTFQRWILQAGLQQCDIGHAFVPQDSLTS
jgi:hypothetical protein